MERRIAATPTLVKEYFNLFVNRRAYTVQSFRPHPESGRHYYYRPTERGSGGCDRSRRCTHRRRAADGRSVTETTMRAMEVVML